VRKGAGGCGARGTDLLKKENPGESSQFEGLEKKKRTNHRAVFIREKEKRECILNLREEKRRKDRK